MAKPQKQHFCSDEGKECSLKKKEDVFDFSCGPSIP